MQRTSDIDSKVLVHVLYRALLDREPDPTGFDAHVSALENGRATTHSIAMSILASSEFTRKQGQSEGVRLDDLRVYAGYTLEDLQLFGHFAAANPQPKDGFVTDFVGSRVRTSLLW